MLAAFSLTLPRQPPLPEFYYADNFSLKVQFWLRYVDV